jgi:hypothetical protein
LNAALQTRAKETALHVRLLAFCEDEHDVDPSQRIEKFTKLHVLPVIGERDPGMTVYARGPVNADVFRTRHFPTSENEFLCYLSFFRRGGYLTFRSEKSSSRDK